MIDANPVLAFFLVLTSMLSMLVAILLERIAYRPLRGAPRLVPLITPSVRRSSCSTPPAASTAGRRAPIRLRSFGGRSKSGSGSTPRRVVIVAALFLMFALYFFINRTRTGRAMRAVSEDKDVAAMMGINVDRIIVTTFAIGGLLAGAAGILYTLLFNQVHFYMGFLPGIKAFTAAVLGGIGNIIGAALGGLPSESLSRSARTSCSPGTGSIAQPAPGRDRLHVLVLVLIFRPSGLLGRRENA